MNLSQFCTNDSPINCTGRVALVCARYVISAVTGQHSILIIDDDGNLRRSLALILEHAGCAVTPAATAQVGLREISQLNFDLIILDLVISDMDSWGLLPLLQQSHSRPSVLVLTGQTYPDLAAELRQKGARGYLLKPVDPDCVLRQVHTLLIERLIPGSVADIATIPLAAGGPLGGRPPS
jgi:DNA-binding NtrC family response regulator